MITYRFDIVSIIPTAFDSYFSNGIIGRSLSSNKVELYLHNPREFTSDKYHKVDDTPYGGGAGMLLKPEPIFRAVESIPRRSKSRVLLMSPQGQVLSQGHLKKWSYHYEQLIFICGNYEGFDERIRTLADEEISVGDFVLTGGEIPAMTIINGVIRLIPGVLGNCDSVVDESHNYFFLEYPQYTRPAIFRNMGVPDVLRSGDHSAIREWRNNKKIERTMMRRPDLYNKIPRADINPYSKVTEDLMDQNQSKNMDFRIGNGYDIHRLKENRPLIIGGVELKHPIGLGLDGHSDADVLVHAIMDALLGALALGDIGKYFPPDDPKWEGSDSLYLLGYVFKLISERGWKVVNIDSVIIAEAPKLKPYINQMSKNISSRLNISAEAVGVKATTNEKLGPEGQGEGISCHAVAMLMKF